MSNKYIQAGKAFFRRDLLLYVLTVLYVFLAMPGCRCRSLPLSTSNFTLKNLTHKCKKKYLQVVQQLGEDGTERLEKTIAPIINPCEVNKFIANLSDYFALCDGVLALLPESKRDRFQQAVSGLFDPIDQGKSINKLKVEQRLQARKNLIDKNYPNEAKVITQLFKLTCEHCSQSAWKPCAKSACKYCSKPTCKHYIDRLIDLSTLLLEDQFITLKNTIIHSTDPEESGRLIISRFTQLVNSAIPPDQYHRFIELPHDKRKRILQSIIDGAKSFSPGDIADIIDEEGNDTEEDIANDGWGDSLQLRNKLRQDFFEVVYTRFAAADRELLKNLLREASPKSIAAFLAAYTSPAFASDHIELLETMLLLYKNEPELTVNTICNHPEKINDKASLPIVRIVRAVGLPRLKILSKLQSFLS